MIVVGIFNLGMGDAEKGLVYINLPTAQTLYNLRDQETEVVVSLEKVGQESVIDFNDYIQVCNDHIRSQVNGKGIHWVVIVIDRFFRHAGIGPAR